MNTNEAACLFIGFDRPNLGKITLEPLMGLQTLYLFCDGPTPKTPNKQREYKTLFEKIRALRTGKKTEIWLPEKNHGQLLGPPSAFHWMLKEEKEGTIVEEDVLTTPYFHQSCAEQLVYHRNNPNILAISSGLPNAYKTLRSPYSQSNLLLVWGWATWYHKIKDIPIPPQKLPNIQSLQLPNLQLILHYQRLKNLLEKNPDYAWSPYLQFYLLAAKKKTLFPRYKSTQNLGIAPKARRSRGNPDIPPQTPNTKTDTKTDTTDSYPILTSIENMMLFKEKHGNLIGEIRTRLAIRTRINKLLQTPL